MGVAAFALEPGQPDTGGRIADNTGDQSLEQWTNALDIRCCPGFNGFANMVKFLLNAEVGQGGNPQFRGEICADTVVGKAVAGQLSDDC